MLSLVCVTLALAPVQAERVVLKCRVIDSAGVPVGGVSVRLQRAPGKSEQSKPVGKTGADGWFQTAELPVDKSYSLEFSANGFLPAFSARSHKLGRGLVELPSVTLRRLRTVRGRIVGTDGGPLGGVLVFQRGDSAQESSVRTGANGEFELADVPELPAIIFTERAGYWFRGVLAPKEDERLVVTLTKRDKSNPEQLDVDRKSSLPRLVDKYVRSGLAVYREGCRTAAKENDQRTVLQNMFAVARIDLLEARVLLTQLTLPIDLVELFNSEFAVIQAATDFDGGITSALAVNDPQQRVAALHQIFLEADPKRKSEVLDRAVAELQVLSSFQQRAHWTSLLYPLATKFGSKKTAGSLLAGLVESIETLDEVDGMAHGAIAEAIAPGMPDRAVELLEKSDPMYSAWVAYQIAPTRPEKAIELLRAYKFQKVGGSRLRRWYSIPRACYRMAPTNVKLARQLADISDDLMKEVDFYQPPSSPRATAADRQLPSEILKAITLGFMARSLVATQPEESRRLLNEAAGMLAPLRYGINSHGRFIYTPSLAMTALVPTAAKIDPGLGAEFCWRALSMRFALTGRDTEDCEKLDGNRYESLQMLALVNRDAAKELMKFHMARHANRCADGDAPFGWGLNAFRIIDPIACHRWVRSLSDTPTIAGSPSIRDQAKSHWLFGISNNLVNKMTIVEQAERSVLGRLWMSGILDE